MGTCSPRKEHAPRCTLNTKRGVCHHYSSSLIFVIKATWWSRFIFITVRRLPFTVLYQSANNRETMTTTCGVAVVVRGLMKKPIIRRNHKRSTNNKLIRVVSEPSWSRSYYEGKEELLFENNSNFKSSSSPLKLSIQDRLRMTTRSNNAKFQSVVCLGTSPRAVVTNTTTSLDDDYEGEEVFVDGEDVYGLHHEYLPTTTNKEERELSSELMQKSAFAVEMAVRKFRSTYFAAMTWENRYYFVREERGQDGSVINLSIRGARLSERLRRRIENEQMSQLERMGRGWFLILDV